MSTGSDCFFDVDGVVGVSDIDLRPLPAGVDATDATDVSAAPERDLRAMILVSVKKVLLIVEETEETVRV